MKHLLFQIYCFVLSCFFRSVPWGNNILNHHPSLVRFIFKSSCYTCTERCSYFLNLASALSLICNGIIAILVLFSWDNSTSMLIQNKTDSLYLWCRMNRVKYSFVEGEKECSLEPDNAEIILLKGSELWVCFVLFFSHSIYSPFEKIHYGCCYLTVDFGNVRRNI